MTQKQNISCIFETEFWSFEDDFEHNTCRTVLKCVSSVFEASQYQIKCNVSIICFNKHP